MSRALRIVFMGTPSFAVASLRALVESGHEVVAAVTQPDQPAGRGRDVQPPAVKEFALGRGIAVEQPPKLRDPAVERRLRELAPEAIVVAAYGKILPKALLELPPHGAINVHASLLPKYRGAAPIQRAILAGEKRTGVTIMKMNERMDEGDILLAKEVAIRDDDTTESLQSTMAEVGTALLVETLDRLVRGDLTPRRQRDEDASLAPMVRREEGLIDWRRPAAEIERATRAFQPWPSAYTHVGGKLLKIHRAAVTAGDDGAAPGTVSVASGDDLEIATGEGRLRLLEVQLEGKRRLGAREFLAGRTVRAGDRLGVYAHPALC
ncbi:MAG: methionyl-tRNA formyltransferase [Candidatus Binatia bacterium]